jgi:hypothetical protein
MALFRFIKFQPSDYVLYYQKGKIKKEGIGLSFFYYQPTATIVMIPASSQEIPYILEAITSDYQTLTLQGNLTFRFKDYQMTAEYLNFSYDPKYKRYLTEDPIKVSSRLLNLLQVLIKKELQALNLTEAMKESILISERVLKELMTNDEIKRYGIEILGVQLYGVSPTVETKRALEAKRREEILKLADEAIYERRNAAILQERLVKENELNTEIKVIEKKREITEKEMDNELYKQKAEQEKENVHLDFLINQEENKKQLVIKEVDNELLKQDVRIKELKETMKIYESLNPDILKALALSKMDANQLIALGFHELASNQKSIGQLNITPELLSVLQK